MAGDAFSMVAIPLLVLEVTRQPAGIGIAMACAAVPRVALVLQAGHMVDRLSARAVLIRARYGHALVLSLLAMGAFLGRLGALELYAASAVLGALSAFSYPAGSTVLPQLIGPERLRAVNTWLFSARHVCTLAGILTAGLLISGIDAGAAGTSAGLCVALLTDAASFVLAAGLLAMTKEARTDAGSSSAAASPPSLRVFWTQWWQDRELRTVFVYFAVVSALMGATTQVGLPMMARGLDSDSATALSHLLVCQCAGTLLGIVWFRSEHLESALGWWLLAADFVVGLLLIALGMSSNLWMAGACLAAIGFVSGALQQRSQRYLQQRLPQQTTGRLMSLLMFMIMVATPVCAMAAGELTAWYGVRSLFLGAGFSVLVFVMLVAGLTDLRRLA